MWPLPECSPVSCWSLSGQSAGPLPDFLVLPKQQQGFHRFGNRRGWVPATFLIRKRQGSILPLLYGKPFQDCSALLGNLGWGPPLSSIGQLLPDVFLVAPFPFPNCCGPVPNRDFLTTCPARALLCSCKYVFASRLRGRVKAEAMRKRQAGNKAGLWPNPKTLKRMLWRLSTKLKTGQWVLYMLDIENGRRRRSIAYNKN